MEDHLHIITGHYGSGKTEFAVNLALSFADAGLTPLLADLDIVNPYFCSREQKGRLTARGVRVVLPCGGGADVPAVNPEVSALLERGVCGVMDVGGDPAGARVLGRFAQRIYGIEHELLCVVNFSRPETNTPEKAEDYLRQIERSARLSVTGLVNNTHLCGDTTREDVRRGARLAKALSSATGIPIQYHAFDARLSSGMRLPQKTLFPMDIVMKKPWETDIEQTGK
ncbi:MAG: ParA family protein [Clostridiales bacterium]|nr:ParA family protein [Clostridiales bacterium]